MTEPRVLCRISDIPENGAKGFPGPDGAFTGLVAVRRGDNVYLYENLDKHVPIAATLDSASNLAAQDRMRTLAARPEFIIPGHDPAIFTRFPTVAPGVVKIDGQRVAVLICYEQILTYPVLASMLRRPTVLVGISNAFWFTGTPIPRYQANAVRAWARLLGIPYLLAVNS